MNQIKASSLIAVLFGASIIRHSNLSFSGAYESKGRIRLGTARQCRRGYRWHKRHKAKLRRQSIKRMRLGLV